MNWRYHIEPMGILPVEDHRQTWLIMAAPDDNANAACVTRPPYIHIGAISFDGVMPEPEGPNYFAEVAFDEHHDGASFGKFGDAVGFVIDSHREHHKR